MLTFNKPEVLIDASWEGLCLDARGKVRALSVDGVHQPGLSRSI